MKVQGVAFAMMLALSSASDAAPLPARNQNPLLSGFGIPGPLPAAIHSDGWSFAADFNWGSTALVQTAPGETLIVDAETREVHLSIGRALSERFALQLRLPWRETSAGSLDGFIDDWHDAFSLPEGDRPILPEDHLRITYVRDGASLVDVASSRSGVGDLSIDLGYAIRTTQSSHLTAWLTAALPTGDSKRLSGDDALDVSLVLAGEQRLGNRWSLFAQAGVSWLGESDLLGDRQRDVLWSGLAGVGWRPWRPIEFKIQLDGHTSAIDDSDLDFLNESLLLTLGGSIHLNSGWRIDLGVSEDIAVETGPDVVFVLGVSRKAASN